MARRRKSRTYGAAKHSRAKINRLVFPKPISAPWLTTVSRRDRGTGHKFGRMHFAIYRTTSFTDPGFGPGVRSIAKKPYTAKVCVGAPGRQKDSAARYLRSSFTKQSGDTGGCEWAGGSTPTRALAAALRGLGTRLTKAKRGR